MEICTSETTTRMATVRLERRLDALSAPDLRHQLEKLRDAGVTRFLIDLSTVTFVDSAGLAVLVRAMKDARSRGGDVEIVQPVAGDAFRVFRLTRFDHVFTMHQETPAAWREGRPWPAS